MAEKFAKGVLDQFESRYDRNNDHNGDPNHLGREMTEQPSMHAARPLESLASQS